jgi:hypothetical protein
MFDQARSGWRHDSNERLGTIARHIGVVCFGVPPQSGFALVRMLHRKLGQIAVHNQHGWTTAATTRLEARRLLSAASTFIAHNEIDIC